MWPGHEFDHAHYRGCLAALSAFLKVLEPMIQNALQPEWQAWFACRRRSVLVLKDLERLGGRCERKLPTLAIDLNTPSAAWGALYAIETPLLRSRAIEMRMRHAQGLSPDYGGSYVGLTDQSAGPLWREFRETLNRIATGPRQRIQSCAGALQTLHAMAFEIENASPQSHRDKTLVAGR